jgi:hypothetical protein
MKNLTKLFAAFALIAGTTVAANASDETAVEQSANITVEAIKPVSFKTEANFLTFNNIVIGHSAYSYTDKIITFSLEGTTGKTYNVTTDDGASATDGGLDKLLIVGEWSNITSNTITIGDNDALNVTYTVKSVEAKTGLTAKEYTRTVKLSIDPVTI